MKRRDFLGVSVGVAGLAGCTDFADSADFDAGTTFSGSDAGPVIDTGLGETDAGPGETDARPGETDAGPGETDAGPASICITISMTVSGDPNHEGEGAERPTAEDVIAGVERTYDIQGISPHPHTFTLSPTDFSALAAGDSVVVISSRNNGHTHDVTVQCMS